MVGLINVQSLGDLQRQEAIDIENIADIQIEPRITQLAAHIRTQWQEAQEAKRPYEDQMLINKRQRKGEYSSQQLAAIQAMHGDSYKPVWMNITETKCRAAESWIKDIIFQPGTIPFDVKPTPMPELPKELTAMLKDASAKAFMEKSLMRAQMGGDFSVAGVIQDLEAAMPDIEKDALRRIKEHAKEAARQTRDKIHDQFIEGGWFPALNKEIYDIVTFGTGVHKGPFVRKDLVRARVFNGQSGRYDPVMEERILPMHGRVNPLMMYPGPDNVDFKDGYSCEKIQLTRLDLSNLIGLEGFDDEAIKEILDIHGQSGLHEWTSIDSEKADLEGRNHSFRETRKIDCIEWWGTASGQMLQDFGFDASEVPDKHKEYSIGAWLIDKFVIKAMLNYDPYGAAPYCKAGFIEDPDSFWFTGVPQLICAPQGIGNAAARAMVNNVAIASGPQVEINIERKAPGTTSTIYPWKVWETSNQGIAEGPAVSFYMPRMVVDKLITVFDFCSNVADEDSGVPRYAHGEAGGLPETSSAFSMLMTQAARGIKNVIKNIDHGIIKPSVEKQYYFNVDFPSYDDPEIIGDIKIWALGSSSQIAKEQQMLRRKEILAEANNPVDNTIFGARGRKKLWTEVLTAAEMDAEEILSDAEETEGVTDQTILSEGIQPPPPAPPALLPDGNPQGGADFNLEQTPTGRNE